VRFWIGGQSGNQLGEHDGGSGTVISARALVALALLTLAVACRTPDKPHMGIPDQDIATPVPAGLVRLVFFNDSNKLLYLASGSVRIQLNGQTLPTVHHNRYTQVFVPPGKYELLLEHFDVVYFTDEYTIDVREPSAYFAVFSQPVSTQYRQVAELPPSFATRWRPAKQQAEW